MVFVRTHKIKDTVEDDKKLKIYYKYFIIKNCGKFSLKQLKILIDMLLDKNTKFLTAKDIALNF